MQASWYQTARMSIPSESVKGPHWPWAWNGRVSHKSREIGANAIWHTPRLVLITWWGRFFLSNPVDDSGADKDCAPSVSFTHMFFTLLSKFLGDLPSILQSKRHNQALSPSYPIETPRFLGILGTLLLHRLILYRLLTHSEVDVKVITEPRKVLRARL